MRREFFVRYKLEAHCERGATIIEIAGVLFIFLTLAMAGFGIVDLVQRRSILTYVLEQEIYGQNIESLTLRDGLVAADANQLRSSFLSIIDSISQKLKDEYEIEDEGGADQFRIELEASEILIDPESGAVQGVQIIPEFHLAEGTLSVPRSLQEEFNLKSEFEKKAGPINSQSLHAIPTGLFGVDSRSRFLPRIVLIGVRAFVSYEGTFTDSVVTGLGIQDHPIVSELIVAPLRGEIGDI